MFDFTNVKEVRLARGAHKSPEQGMCFMEMAAWFAGEEHSDKPACVSPSLGSLGISLNDTMPDGLRDKMLKPMIPHVVGTADKASEVRRVEYICLRAFNYAGGIVFHDFARRGPARSFGEAQHMVQYLDDAARYRDYNHSLSPHSLKATGFSLIPSRLHDPLSDLLVRMFRPLTSFDHFEPVSATASVKDLTITHPNTGNAELAAGVFAHIAEHIIPDHSAGIDTLQQAIKLGRHDGFDLAVNLETRHANLRELVEA